MLTTNAARSALMLFTGVLGAALLALIIGESVATKTLTEYRQISDEYYVWFIRDMGSSIQIDLVGRRCYKTPPIDPEWIAVRQQYQPSYAIPAPMHIIDPHPVYALDRLRCP